MRGIELNLPKSKCSGKVSAAEVRVSELRAAEIRAGEGRVPEVRVEEFRVAEVRVAEAPPRRIAPMLKSQLYSARAVEENAIEGRVDDEQREAVEQLVVAREGGGVKDRGDVVRDEVPRVGGSSPGFAEEVLERGQGAGPARELDGGAPAHRGYVEPDNPLPSECQQAAEEGKQDEAQVNDESEICEGAIHHGYATPCPVGPGLERLATG